MTGTINHFGYGFVNLSMSLRWDGGDATMVIVMDMATGKKGKTGVIEPAADGFGAFVDEVLNAGWLPQPEARLETHATEAKALAAVIEPEEFLRNLYRNQE